MQQPKWLSDVRHSPAVMGVLNVTPDSFSDGGSWLDPATAARRAREMLTQGATIIDIGGESTRPGSQPVGDAEQIKRVVPVIRQIVEDGPAVISIDTTRASVANAALDAGASIVNDISAGRDDPAMFPLTAARKVPIILMHMQGSPATMQLQPTYSDVTAEVQQFLLDRLAVAEQAGIDRSLVLFDPGIGFGKTDEHNLQLLRDLPMFVALGQPIVVGTSRKGFIGRITGEADPADRRFGTAATVAWSITNGAAVVRVHDVEPMVRVVRMVRAIQK